MPTNLNLIKDAVFLTFVGIPTFSDLPTFFFFFFFPFFLSFPRACIVYMCNDHACQLVAFWAAPGPRWGLCPQTPRPTIISYFLNSPSGLAKCTNYNVTFM